MLGLNLTTALLCKDLVPLLSQYINKFFINQLQVFVRKLMLIAWLPGLLTQGKRMIMRHRVSSCFG